mmetsp:Transcript_9974/g.24410  ORF Transcript_9974/g.24410 Transcript_9974/m.24410 type:complete len:87 (+) Transcript_9974:528-788(+)
MPYPLPHPGLRVTAVSSKPPIFLSRPVDTAIHLLLLDHATYSPSNTDAYPNPPSPLPSPAMPSPPARPDTFAAAYPAAPLPLRPHL